MAGRVGVLERDRHFAVEEGGLQGRLHRLTKPVLSPLASLAANLRFLFLLAASACSFPSVHVYDLRAAWFLFLAMSAPPRRSSRRLAAATTAAPSPVTPPPVRLLDLPTALLEHVLSRCDSPPDIARAAGISRVFHASLAVEGIRLWAQERGYELPAQPEGETCAVRWLCFAALLCESNPPARAAAGEHHSLFIVGKGRLSSCGSAPSYSPALLGHGEGVTRLNTPTRLPSTLGERAVSVAAGDAHSLALTGSGAVWSWGSGHYRLGHGDAQDRLLCPRRSRPLLASASSLCRLDTTKASLSPPTVPSGAGAREPLASWATATSRTSCCPRRSRRGVWGGERWGAEAGTERVVNDEPVSL